LFILIKSIVNKLIVKQNKTKQEKAKGFDKAILNKAITHTKAINTFTKSKIILTINLIDTIFMSPPYFFNVRKSVKSNNIFFFFTYIFDTSHIH
jgi:hypothetical protein